MEETKSFNLYTRLRTEGEGEVAGEEEDGVQGRWRPWRTVTVALLVAAGEREQTRCAHREASPRHVGG